MGAAMAVGMQYAHPRLIRGSKEQITALHKDIFMEGSNTSIKRQTKQNAAILGVYLVVLGQLWGLLWPWVCNMPLLD